MEDIEYECVRYPHGRLNITVDYRRDAKVPSLNYRSTFQDVELQFASDDYGATDYARCGKVSNDKALMSVKGDIKPAEIHKRALLYAARHGS